MDLTTIEDEIYKFSKDFFYDASIATDEGLSFIEDNQLYLPKENYTIVGTFLSNTVKNFRVLDSTFMNSTLKKLDNDIKHLQHLLDETIANTQNIQDVFEKEFIRSSKSLTNFSREILKAKKISTRRALTKMLQELKTIYYQEFEEIFIDDKKYFILSLMKILNSKTYYFDKLIWKEASKSNVITKHFQLLKIKNRLNTKDYLLYTTGLMRPYTKEYQYLQSCLRIYK